MRSWRWKAVGISVVLNFAATGFVVNVLRLADAPRFAYDVWMGRIEPLLLLMSFAILAADWLLAWRQTRKLERALREQPETAARIDAFLKDPSTGKRHKRGGSGEA